MKPLKSLGRETINNIHAQIQQLILASEGRIEWDKLTDMVRERYKKEDLKRENAIFIVGYFCGRDAHAKQLKTTMDKMPFKDLFNKILGGE